MINWHLSKRYPLISITWPYRGLKFTAHRGRVFFEVDRWPSAGFSFGSRAHVWVTCWKQSRIVRKPVNANPGLKVNRTITFLLYKCFAALFCVYGDYWNSKQKAKQCTENLSANNLVPRSLVDEAEGEDLAFRFVYKRSGNEITAQSYKPHIKILIFPGLA